MNWLRDSVSSPLKEVTLLKKIAKIINALFTMEQAAIASPAFQVTGLGMFLFHSLESTLEKVVIETLASQMR